FRVDVEELNKRLEEGRERKEANLQRLHDEYGLPLGKMTEYKRKENYFQKHKNPLATIAGKKWLEEVFSSFGAPAMPRTAKPKDISSNKDDLHEVISFSGVPQKIRRHRMDPANVQFDKIKDLCELIISVTGERTVYQTIENH